MTIRDKISAFLAKDNLDGAIYEIEKIVNSLPLRDIDYSDQIIMISQRNRNVEDSSLSGIIDRDTYLREKANITKAILSLTKQLDDRLIASSDTLESNLPQIKYLSKIQEENIQEVRSKMIHIDKSLMVLYQKLDEAKPPNSNHSHMKIVDYLSDELAELKLRIQEEKSKYNILEREYRKLKKDSEKIIELDNQVQKLEFDLRSKKIEIEALENNFLLSRSLIESQNREIENLRKR